MSDATSDARPVGKEACPDCGSSDNLVRYSDGHAYCFTPGCARFERENGDVSAPQRRETRMDYDFLTGEVRALRARGIAEETCAKFGYLVGRDKHDQPVQIAQYRDRETGLMLCAQKLRFPDKGAGMPVIGDIDKAGLFGEHLWKGARQRDDWKARVVVCEGEIDAMSIAQVFNLTMPVVSIKRGAASAKKDCQQSLAFLEAHDEIILWFDADEAGRKAVAECAPLFSPGKVRIVETPQ